MIPFQMGLGAELYRKTKNLSEILEIHQESWQPWNSFMLSHFDLHDNILDCISGLDCTDFKNFPLTSSNLRR